MTVSSPSCSTCTNFLTSASSLVPVWNVKLLSNISVCLVETFHILRWYPEDRAMLIWIRSRSIILLEACCGAPHFDDKFIMAWKAKYIQHPSSLQLFFLVCHGCYNFQHEVNALSYQQSNTGYQSQRAIQTFRIHTQKDRFFQSNLPFPLPSTNLDQSSNSLMIPSWFRIVVDGCRVGCKSLPVSRSVYRNPSAQTSNHWGCFW